MAKITLQDIKDKIEPLGWQVLSEEYHNQDELMNFECPSGHSVSLTWKKLRYKDRYECPRCKENKFEKTEKIIPKPRGKYRVLAIDQATYTCGYSIFDGKELTSYGIYNVPDGEEFQRSHNVKEWLVTMIDNWRPDRIAFEGIQFQTSVNGQQHSMGVTVFQTLAHLQGILCDLCYEKGINFEICATNTWRHYCGVKGNTRTDKKRSMQLLVKKWYGIDVSDDESDAIGIGKYVSENYYKNLETENWE